MHFDNTIETDWMQPQQNVPSIKIWSRRAIELLLAKEITLDKLNAPMGKCFT
jgi:hypothetical protein